MTGIVMMLALVLLLVIAVLMALIFVKLNNITDINYRTISGNEQSIFVLREILSAINDYDELEQNMGGDVCGYTSLGRNRKFRSSLLDRMSKINREVYDLRVNMEKIYKILEQNNGFDPDRFYDILLKSKRELYDIRVEVEKSNK